MAKWTSIGALLGLVIGFILYLLIPSLLNVDLQYNFGLRNSLGLSNSYFDPKLGSVYSVGTFIPVISGLIGASIGFLGFKIKNLKHKKT